MADDESYTTEEVAKLLKVSKLTVYDLLKKGELPSYRVGKQMRVDRADLEAYKASGKSGMALAGKTVSHHAPSVDRTDPPSRTASGGRTLVITGQDVALDVLARHIEGRLTGVRPLREYVGSMDSLVAMYRGDADIVSTHLLDGDTGEYNLPYIRKLLVGFPCLVVNLVKRNAGFYVRKGNPGQIHQWADLKKPGIRLANREKGSGARVLLDEQLRLHGISSNGFPGYEVEESSHLGVAGKVASGQADVGVGIEKAAQLVGGIDFVPLIEERYDLVMLKNQDNEVWIREVIDIVRSASFRNELDHIQGYDLSLTGHMMYETT